MEPEGTLPPLQVLATCPYPEPDTSSSCPPPYILKTHSNIFLPSTPRSSKWFLSFRFPPKNHVYIPLLPDPRHTPLPSQFSRFCRPNTIWWGVKILPTALWHKTICIWLALSFCGSSHMLLVRFTSYLSFVLFYQCHNGVLDVHIKFCRTGCFNRGTRRRSWLRHCATRRKVAGSISDGVIAIFHWHNPSGRNTALGST
jgi:hypothetical protein